MAVKLESTIKRYLGLSTDDKPVGNFETGETIPAGSSFLETDTGRIYRFDSDDWRFAAPTSDIEMLLTVIYLEIHELRFTVGMLTAV